MACTGTPCARCWPTPCRRAIGDRLRPGVLTLRQAQEEPFTAVIDQILVDELRRPRKQRHTVKRSFERQREYIRAERSKGVSQRDLAKRLEVSRWTIQQVDR